MSHVDIELWKMLQNFKGREALRSKCLKEINNCKLDLILNTQAYQTIFKGENN